jgi:hypothetical protein
MSRRWRIAEKPETCSDPRTNKHGNGAKSYKLRQPLSFSFLAILIVIVVGDVELVAPNAVWITIFVR